MGNTKANLLGLVVMSLILSACGQAGSKGNGSNTGSGIPQPGCKDQTDRCAFLNAHNQVRASATPTPSPALPTMIYSATLETAANTWAEKCNFTYDPALGAMGQNVFASNAATTAANVITRWAAQASDYTYSTNTCASGKVCGNYTQLVWRTTTEVGCAMKTCSTGSPFGTANGGTWYFAVCNYNPGGNFIGLSPY